jgi:hypothetical protein
MIHLRPLSMSRCVLCVSGTTTSGEARGAVYCACSVCEVCCQNSMSVCSSGQHGESAKENIRRAFDSMPATTRQEESGSRLQRAREKVWNAFLQFLFRPFQRRDFLKKPHAGHADTPLVQSTRYARRERRAHGTSPHSASPSSSHTARTQGSGTGGSVAALE